MTCGLEDVYLRIAGQSAAIWTSGRRGCYPTSLPEPWCKRAMSDHFSNRQQIRKSAVISKGGIVASQSRRAAEIGAEVLAAGGDCIDAVIATGFALGVLEPWMSGVGGGGAMVLYRARDNR